MYDWTVPPEWNVDEAWIRDGSGETVVDVATNTLHLVNYSVPMEATLSFDELEPHLYTLPEMVDTIPYRTSYYERDWGFCLRQNTFDEMDRDETYEVRIDAELDEEGSLTYADARVEGKSEREYVLSTYCCHPSMANDNLSGLILATLLFERIRQSDPYHSYRLIIVPETIGAIAYLHDHERAMKSVDGGYVVTTTAGPGSFGYKESFRGDHPVDTAARLALDSYDYDQYDFAPTGSDERQYSTPGFRIPTGSITKDKYYEYDAYHTSEDDLSFVSADALERTLEIYWDAIQYLEMDRVYTRRQPHCEFKLDRHDLHPTTGGQKHQPAHLGDESHSEHDYGDDETVTTGDVQDGINWLMFGCDGETSLFALAEQSGLSVLTLFRAAQALQDADLIVPVEVS
ncbi:DUF4910 domain-containing protein [Haloarculaceae archaeon H-GB2-1]|nr:DUF4910 domain-containing protein [Haloarculaceae archaeon H-GB11]MEA5406488.1 DUF4910 domain-containing protein [Haloarculaceae archaeon H-GB2-1]